MRMKTINVKVDFLRFKNFYVVRVYASKSLKGGDYLCPSLDSCYKLVDSLNN